MKIYKFYECSEEALIDNLSRELEKIVPKIKGTKELYKSWLFKTPVIVNDYNWEIGWRYADIEVRLYDKSYEKEFISVCKKFGLVDALCIF